MTVEWTFRAGDFIIIVTFLSTALLYAIRMGRFTMRIEMQNELTDRRLQSLEHGQEMIGESLRTLAVQGSRLDRLEADLRELRHGDGIVMPRGGHK